MSHTQQDSEPLDEAMEDLGTLELRLATFFQSPKIYTSKHWVFETLVFSENHLPGLLGKNTGK